MGRYQGIIFDMDGVLCRTDCLHRQVWEWFTDKYGLPFSEEIHRRLLGRGREESMDIVLGKWGETLTRVQKDALIREKNERYLALIEDLSDEDLKPCVRETLEKLRQMGLRLALGSSSRNAAAVIQKLRLEEYFDARVDATQVQRVKPAPDIFLTAAERIGLVPGLCLVVDDGEAGVDAAVRGGFDVAGIGPSAEDPRCRYRLETLGGLLEIVGKEDTADGCH